MRWEVRGLWEEVWRFEVGGEEVSLGRFGGLRWEVRRSLWGGWKVLWLEVRRSLWGGWKVLWLEVRGLWEEVWRFEVGGERSLGGGLEVLRLEVRGLWEKVWRF